MARFSRQRREAGDVLLVLVQRRLGLGQHAVGGGEPFLERLVVELEERVALLHLGAFGEEHLVHERLDARAHLDVLRRIQLPDELGGHRHVGRGDVHHLHDRRRRRRGAAFLQPEMPKAIAAASGASAIEATAFRRIIR